MYLCSSKRHVSKDILTCDDAFQSTCTWVCYWQTPQVHMAEHIQDLLKTVCTLSQKGCLDHVWTNVNHLVKVSLANVSNFFIFSIRWVVVSIEKPPIKFFISYWNLSLISKHGKLTKNFNTVFNLFHFSLKFSLFFFLVHQILIIVFNLI